MLIFMLIVVIALAGIGAVASLRSGPSGGGKGGGLISFYAKGKDAGFSFKEIELLRRLALRADLDDPTALFWSQDQLDLCIKTLVKNARLTGGEQDEEHQEFLTKLYEYRKRIEVTKTNEKPGLSNSRSIDEGIPVIINLKGVGNFNSRIIKNTSQYLTVARPVTAKIPQSFAWTGQRVAVFFQRENDAGYVFDAEVMDEVYSKGYTALQLTQPVKMDRTQRRNSVRVKTQKPAFLYLLGDGEASTRLETAPGYKCIMEDLSDSGCAVTIGGKGIPDLRVKIQFVLDSSPLTMCGTVRSVDFKEAESQSVLHIQADELPQETKNLILTEVFGMTDDDEEPMLPFRVSEEEAGEDQSKEYL